MRRCVPRLLPGSMLRCPAWVPAQGAVAGAAVRHCASSSAAGGGNGAEGGDEGKGDDGDKPKKKSGRPKAEKGKGDKAEKSGDPTKAAADKATSTTATTGSESGPATTITTPVDPKNATAASAPNPQPPAPSSVRDMLPRQLMAELDKFIVGQSEAKRAVAVALRNRWRRHQVEPKELRDEINPKNILMIGPTGVGKTEIARRLAKLTDAPFVKVEATKFTEVGFHGRDVDSIIEDLLKVSLSQTKNVLMRRHEEEAQKRAEARVLKALAGSPSGFEDHLQSGALNDVDVTIELREKKEPPKQNVGEGPQTVIDIPAMMGLSPNKPKLVKRTLKIAEALPLVKQEELDKLVEGADLTKEAIRACEEDGIVVIDEIDKIVTPSTGHKGHQASAEGVQQDLLPLIEGTTVSCKAANGAQIKTDKILFICSGAFHMVKPSDMLAELQGRLPIRVELKALTEADFLRIITEPQYNLIRQNAAMLATEGVELDVRDDAKREIARIAAHVNGTVQNIGARRLITITERVLEDINFDGPELAHDARAKLQEAGETTTTEDGKPKLVTKFTIDGAYVRKAVDALVAKVDVSKYLL
jgi:ATP-dependent HslUV protease ATP-binding subunit HslU